MEFLNLHEWDLTPVQARAVQNSLRTRISLKDSIALKKLSWVGGGDVSYARDGRTLFGGVVVLSFPDLVVVEQKWVVGRISFPYIPGLLSFREAPVLIHAFSRLRQRPDAILCDGQGAAHPRGFGLACHLSLLLGLPSVGCAKSRLVAESRPVGRGRGAVAWHDNHGRHVGKVVRTRTDVKPVYVSPGNGMSFDAAVQLVFASCRDTRLPEPIRRAHQLVSRVRNDRS